ncbi:hypothetical protein AAHC03_013756 [Spirometra sp. Aus1]
MDLQLQNASLKLMYFNIRGRGELIRSILYAAGKQFTDQRIDLRDWLALKPKMPFGQVPVLEVTPPSGNTILLTESLAIARLLARAFKMYGSSPMDIYYIERILSVNAVVANDVYSLMLKKASDVHLHLKDAYITEKLDSILEFMKEMNGPFIGGNSVTIADLDLLILQDLVDRAYPNLKHDVKERLVTLRNNVFREKPGLERYYRSRPQTDF